MSFALGNGESDPRVGDYPVAILVAVADNSVGHGQSLGQIAGEMRLEMFGASSRTRTGCRVTFGRFCWPCFPTRQFCRQSTTIQKIELNKNKKQKLVYLIRTATALESSLPVVYCSLNRCVDLDRPDSANRGRQNDERKEPDRRRRPASCWVPPLNGFRPSSLHSSPARKCPDGNAVKASYGKRCQNRWDRLARHTTPVVS